MKSNVTYQFEQDSSATINVCGHLGAVILEHKMHNIWDPREEKEVAGLTQTINMTIEDAKELANNLLKAAEFASNGPAIKGTDRYFEKYAVDYRDFNRGGRIKFYNQDTNEWEPATEEEQRSYFEWRKRRGF